MALGRRYWSRARLILSEDPAVDIDRSDVKKYQDTLDVSHLKLHEGARPTVYEVKALTYRQRKAVYSLGLNQIEALELAFRCGVVAIENYSSVDATTGEGTQLPPLDFETNDLGKLVAREWLEKGIRMVDVATVGTMIFGMSEGQAKN